MAMPPSDALALLEKMDWKLWEIYKTAKRAQKYSKIEDIDVAKSDVTMFESNNDPESERYYD